MAAQHGAQPVPQEPAGGFKLHIAQAVHAEPGGQAESHHHDTGVLSPHHDGQQREDRAYGADAVEQEGHAAGSETEVQEAMVDVPAVSPEDGLAGQEPANHRKTDLEKRQREGHGGRGESQAGSRLLAPDDAVGAKQKADEQGAGIPQEDGSGIEVVSQKTDQASGQRRGGERQHDVAMEQGGDESGERGGQADARSQAVDAVDQVERIAAKDQPRNRHQAAAPGREEVSGEAHKADSGLIGPGRRRQLAQKFLPGFEAEPVVDEAGRENQADRRQEGGDRSHVALDYAARPEGRQKQQGVRRDVRDQDGDTAGARRGLRMSFPPAVGAVDKPQTRRPVAGQRRQQQAQQTGCDGEKAE